MDRGSRFGKLLAVSSRELLSDSAISAHHSTTEWPSRACLCKTAALWTSLEVVVRGEESQMEGDYHGQRRTTWFQWKEVKTPDIHRRSPANCGQKAHACSTVLE